MNEVLLISVGGSSEQLKFSLKEFMFDYIIFFVSDSSKNILDENKKEYLCAKEIAILKTEDVNDLSKCFTLLHNNIEKILKQWGRKWEDLLVDYTGGTKAMVAAIIMATSENCSNYRYIGGNNRTKNGVGIVENGYEKSVYRVNPWNKIALRETYIIDELFNKARYSTAKEKVDNTIKKVSDENLKRFFLIISKICDFYIKWDNFEHYKALYLSEILDVAKEYQKEKNIFNNFLEEFKKNIRYISNIEKNMNANCNKDSANLYLLLSKDLIANAVRRIYKEHKYEDATARLYSAIEKNIKGRLLKFGIDNSSIELEKIPEELKTELNISENIKKDFQLKFGLYKSCMLLAKLDKEFNKNFYKYEKKYTKIMSKRNNSILGHGSEPINKKTCISLLEITLKITQIKKEELVQIPEFKLKSWIKNIPIII